MSDANKRMGVRATFEVYEDDGGKWRWRMIHRNGNIIADSAEGYSSAASREEYPSAEVVCSEGLTARATLLCADCADPTMKSHKYIAYETPVSTVFVSPVVARRVRDHEDGEPIPDGGPITDVDLVPVDEDVIEAGYPVGALNQAILVSQERFRAGLPKWGEGDRWTSAPRDLANGVARNARGAVLELEDGNHAEARQEIGDALNYLLFLRDLISVREGGDST